MRGSKPKSHITTARNKHRVNKFDTSYQTVKTDLQQTKTDEFEDNPTFMSSKVEVSSSDSDTVKVEQTQKEEENHEPTRIPGFFVPVYKKFRHSNVNESNRDLIMNIQDVDL